MGLGMHHEKELLALKERYQKNEITVQQYKNELFEKMNDTGSETISSVQTLLEKMRRNLYGLETDEGKLDVITGRFDISYQWSGDAVYTMDMGEESEISDEPLYLEYAIPESASNLFFDAWVLMKNCKNVEAATAFVNFISMPENVVRNMYYIGYTSCISGPSQGENAIFDYIDETYSYDEIEDADETPVPYDLSYFFGKNHSLTVAESQTRRQLFAQYPKTETIERLVVMKTFPKSVNETLNRIWNSIK
jgi:spermidine/putrescine transport system substrate-binding protein